jgi:hypothetical protein
MFEAEPVIREAEAVIREAKPVIFEQQTNKHWMGWGDGMGRWEGPDVKALTDVKGRCEGAMGWGDGKAKQKGRTGEGQQITNLRVLANEA